jgi:hypothetical protein
LQNVKKKGVEKDVICSGIYDFFNRDDWTNREKKSWYFKLGGSYFMQTAGDRISSGFRSVAKHGCLCSNGTTLLSRETNHGSFGEGFRVGVTGGYRVSSRLGLRWDLIILKQ